MAAVASSGRGLVQGRQRGVAGELGRGAEGVALEPLGERLEGGDRRRVVAGGQRELGREDRGGELGQRLPLALVDRLLQLVDLAGADRPGGEHRAGAARSAVRARGLGGGA